MPLGPRALQPRPVGLVRIEEDAEEEDVAEVLAPRRRFDGDVAVKSRLLRPIMVQLPDGLDFDHHARNVPGDGREYGMLPLAIGHTYEKKTALLSEIRIVTILVTRGHSHLRSR